MDDLMDDLAQFNMERWNALARAGIEYTVPYLDMDKSAARRLVDRNGLIGDVDGKDVLCLAAGGGQQSAAFALLGATVTVLDLSEIQLERDREAARHYGLEIRTLQGDMRDLSRFKSDSFDLVWHAHSINFVPDAVAVFAQAARVLRRGGVYRLSCANPYFQNVEPSDWNEGGYRLWDTYGDGELSIADPHWEFADPDGENQRVRGPREFRHTLTTLINGMIGQGFRLVRVGEYGAGEGESDAGAEPRTWEHFKSVAPPYLDFWAVRES